MYIVHKYFQQYEKVFFPQEKFYSKNFKKPLSYSGPPHLLNITLLSCNIAILFVRGPTCTE